MDMDRSVCAKYTEHPDNDIRARILASGVPTSAPITLMLALARCAQTRTSSARHEQTNNALMLFSLLRTLLEREERRARRNVR